jgi:hypothetical protein
MFNTTVVNNERCCNDPKYVLIDAVPERNDYASIYRTSLTFKCSNCNMVSQKTLKGIFSKEDIENGGIANILSKIEHGLNESNGEKL